MNVGILTFHFADNYGAVLQAYATKSFLEKNGVNVKIVNYASEQLLTTYEINPLKYKGIDLLRAIVKYPYIKKQHLLFEKFREKYLDLHSEPTSNFSEACVGFDAIIVGSDQVWNSTIIFNDESYFLADINLVKRIGYAVSIGRYDNDNTSALIKKYAHKFDFLSIREKKAIEYCYNLTGIKARNVVDPVFLLDYEDWITLEKMPVGFKYDKYILMYILEKNESLYSQLIELSHSTGLPIISIHPTCSWFEHKNVQNYSGVGPREFIWLLHHAEYVGTNSFHGTVFSAVFSKKIVFAAHKTLGDRNQNLMSLFNFDSLNGESIFDFVKADKTDLKNFVEESQEFLLRAIHNED